MAIEILCIGNGCLGKHPFLSGCLGFHGFKNNPLKTPEPRISTSLVHCHVPCMPDAAGVLDLFRSLSHIAHPPNHGSLLPLPLFSVSSAPGRSSSPCNVGTWPSCTELAELAAAEQRHVRTSEALQRSNMLVSRTHGRPPPNACSKSARSLSHRPCSSPK